MGDGGGEEARTGRRSGRRKDEKCNGSWYSDRSCINGTQDVGSSEGVIEKDRERTGSTEEDGGEHRESDESDRRKRGVMRETGRLIHIWKKNSP